MEYTNKKKSVLCKYFLENRCKYKINKCKYSHGSEDIHTIECKYGARCINSRCNFNHGASKSKIYPTYEPIIKYKKNKKIIKPIYLNNINNKIIIDEESYKKIIKPNEESDSEVEDSKYDIINIIKEENNNSDNKLITILDDYYYNIINQKNILIDNLLNKIENLKNPKSKKYSTNMEKYQKYYKLNIAIESGSKYDNMTKDKNIHKLKLRCSKVKIYIDTIKKYNIKTILPISKILNSTKISFSNILNNIIHHVFY